MTRLTALFLGEALGHGASSALAPDRATKDAYLVIDADIHTRTFPPIKFAEAVIAVNASYLIPDTTNHFARIHLPREVR